MKMQKFASDTLKDGLKDVILLLDQNVRAILVLGVDLTGKKVREVRLVWNVDEQQWDIDILHD